MDEIARLGIEIDASDALGAARSLESLTTSSRSAETATQSLAAGAKTAQQQLAEFGRSARIVAPVDEALRSVETATRMVAQASGGAASAAREMAAAVMAVEAADRAAAAAGRQLAQANQVVEASTARAAAQAQRAAVSYTDFYDATQHDFAAQYVGQMGRVSQAHVAGAASSKAMTQATLNLSRQFADVAVTAAMGMNPLMILIQQGPQIADGFQTAATQGLNFKAVLAGFGATLAPFLPVVLAIGTIAAAAFGGAALAARDLNKDNANLAKSLGLTEKQLDHLKDAGVKTGVTIGDVFKGTFTYIRDAAGPALAPVVKFFNDLFDRIASGAVAAVKVVVGSFAAGFAAIKAVWSGLPSTLGDLVTTTANTVIGVIEKMINTAIDRVNTLVRFANAAAGAAGVTARLPQAEQVELPRIANPDAGAAGRAADTVQAAAAAAYKQAAAGVDRVLDGMGKAITKAAEDRIRKAAGVAGRTPAMPRDTTDERAAQIDGLLAQAKADELQAQIAVTRSLGARAELEKQVLTQETAVKQARLASQIASIEDDKGLSAARKSELVAQVEAIKAVVTHTGALKAQAVVEAMTAALAKEALDVQVAQKQAQVDLLGSQADLTKSSFARALLENQILRVQQDIERAKLAEVTAANGATDTQIAIAKAQLGVLDQVHENERKLAAENTTLLRAIEEATGSVGDLKSAINRHDWSQVFDDLQRTIQTIQASFAANGMSGGLMTAGAAAGSLLGGKTGNAVASGIGLAGFGMAAGGALASASTGFLVSGALAGTLGSAGLAMGNLGLAVAGLLGPIGIIAGAGLALSTLLKSKPSNAGAGIGLTPDSLGALSGKSRSPETEQAATGAAQAILQGEAVLRQAGITLGATVSGLVIGSRDLSQVYLSNGKTVTSAVGDVAAAAEAGLKAVIEGATYTSDAQKKLVESMVAAGKGFDDIGTALQNFQAAQAIGSGLADQILQLTDPKAYDLQAVHRDADAQRAAAMAAADAGYLTADQLTAINAQLSTLEGLKIDDALKRYVDAANDNTSLTDQIAKAQANLAEAYDRQSSALQDTIDSLTNLAKGLRDYGNSLDTGAAGNLSPFQQAAAAKAAFDQIDAAARGGDKAAAGQLQAAAEAYITAEKAIAPNALALNQVVATVRASVDAAADAAQGQADAAQQQLDLLNKQVDGLLDVNKSVLLVVDAVRELKALQAQASAITGGGTSGPAAAQAPAGFNAAGYAAKNPDVEAAYQQYAAGGGYYSQFFDKGLTEAQFLAEHYNITGKDEGRGFATGGDGIVGGTGGTDSKRITIRATPGELVSVRTPGQRSANDAALVSAINAMTDEIRAMRADVKAGAADARKLANLITAVTHDGRALQTEQAA